MIDTEAIRARQECRKSGTQGSTYIAFAADDAIADVDALLAEVERIQADHICSNCDTICVPRPFAPIGTPPVGVRHREGCDLDGNGHAIVESASLKICNDCYSRMMMTGSTSR